VTETLKRFVREVSQFSDETLIITLSILILVLVILVVYWHYNKKKFHQLSHQIPASVLKTYLDSIIQNSTSLKSSLFRGGGLEIGNGIPSVVPVGDLPIGNVSVGDSSEELNQKNAEISSLTQRLADKDRQLGELDAKLREAQAASLTSGGGGSSEEVAILQAEIEKLRAELEALRSAAPAAGGDDAMAAQLADVTKERDELKERLMEYEIIEEDLANLKRLQQENDQLKKTIAELQAGSPPAAEAAPAPTPEPTPEPAAEPAPEPAAEIPAEAPAEDDLEAQMAAAITETPAAEEAPAGDDVPANEGEQKSAEELLSEFEKMLG
jgi:outer membrane murein-binding lipoprotein Lpp